MPPIPTSSDSPQVVVQHISTSIVKPYPPSPKPCDGRRYHLTSWDLTLLSAHYNQKGLLFSTSTMPSFDVLSVIHRLKASLAAVLCHFYPLAGRLVTENVYDDHGNHVGMFVAVDCNDNGVEFIHAFAEGVTVNDVVAAGKDVPEFVRQFFPTDNMINCDGHTLPLLVVQLTELVDGHFIALCFNHAMVDGTSYWHFFNAWAEICRSTAGNTDDGFAAVTLSRPPMLDRWFGEYSPPLKLPFTTHEEFIERFKPPLLRGRVFHFSMDSLVSLKARANKEYEEGNKDGNMISTLQALTALMWRSITRARGLPRWQKTECRMAIDCRSRLRPPLHTNYFGNSIKSSTSVEELLNKNLGWSAALLRLMVAEHDDKKIRTLVQERVQSPVFYQLGSMFDAFSVMVGSSPRFETYECEFGWGRAVAVRSGIANKFCGKIMAFPGREGCGSVDLEVCLVPNAMDKLLHDPEFLEVVSTDQPLT